MSNVQLKCQKNIKMEKKSTLELETREGQDSHARSLHTTEQGCDWFAGKAAYSGSSLQRKSYLEEKGPETEPNPQLWWSGLWHRAGCQSCQRGL